MTEKQEKILQSALELFAEKGYDATSTSLIAKEAGVSEGLIFRHFKNKEGLLEAIMQKGSKKAEAFYNSILAQSKPENIIKEVISLPFKIEEKEYQFWRLLYALKWKSNIYDDSLSKPLKDALINSFQKLEYKNPEAEAEMIMLLIDGAATAILLRNPSKKKEILACILDKYNI